MTPIELFQKTGFEKPTEMQESYWKNASNYTVLLANTGSGKTIAFSVHLEQILLQNKQSQSVIICPTRELAIQVSKNYGQLKTGRKIALCYGGHSFKNECLQLQEKPEIIVTTPGRILDHIERNTFGLIPFENLIVDEYDKTMEMGFLNEISKIIQFAAKLKSIQLVSATEIVTMPEILKDYSFSKHSFTTLELPKISYKSLESIGHDKLNTLVSFLSNKDFGSILIFCTHRESAERISKHLIEFGKSNVLFHGGMEQIDRERALVKFRNGSENCLVCTDLAARGIDIPEIEAVFHYQFPHSFEDFTHRNGRTARMKNNGDVYLLHSENEPLPDYTSQLNFQNIAINYDINDFKDSNWVTLYLSAGRKEKIRKVDIVGFFLKETQISKEDLGIIDVYDSYSYVAISRKKSTYIKSLFPRIKIKKQPILLSFCR
jgi:superfamily II DNA/RNA helicase